MEKARSNQRSERVPFPDTSSGNPNPQEEGCPNPQRPKPSWLDLS